MSGTTASTTMSGTTATTTDASTTTDPTSTTTADTGSSTGDTSGSTADSTGSVNEGFSFFATSVGSGAAGGNLGGLEGADATCQALAEAAGSSRTWRAYLSTSTENARDRIGTGPWLNTADEMIAMDVDDLHDNGLSNGDPQHVLDENGDEVPANEHDILTGSDDDGTLHPSGNTCEDWTSDGGADQARLGHSDIPANPQFSPSWNNAHDSQGCDAQSLVDTGGAGRLYCFAID
jgi:hypothetical protein